MIADAATVAWKEARELRATWGMHGGRLGLLVLVAVLAVLGPLQIDLRIVNSPATVAMWASVPPFVVFPVIIDAFAGERERHTFETLLASRLPNPAILLGKITTAALYGWAVTVVCALIGSVIVAVRVGGAGPGSRLVATATGAVLAIALTALVAAAVGAVVSLRATGVRQAQQALSLTWMAFVFGAAFGLPWLARTLPARWVDPAADWFHDGPPGWLHGWSLPAAAVILPMTIAAIAVRCGLHRLRLLPTGRAGRR